MDNRNDDVGTRAGLYHWLSEAFHFPDADRYETFRSGAWGNRVVAGFVRLDYPFPADAGLRLGARQDEYEVEFLRLYEVGMGGAPCPLSSGYYTRDRMRDLEEVVRFYRFFGYQPQRSSDRFPDHLAFELEFMAHLADREIDPDGDLASLRRGQRDFCERHLASWIPQLRDAVERRTEIRFFREVMQATESLVAADLVSLDAVVGEEKQTA